MVSPKQRQILEWLLAYPGVRLSYGPDAHANWTAAWRDAAARQHMVGILPHLGIDGSFTRPRAVDLDGPTPHVTRPTVAALLRQGLIQDVGGNTLNAQRYYQISKRGVLTVRHYPAQQD